MIGLVLALLLGFWIGSGVVWFQVDSPYMPLRLRLWRAATWLPAWILLLLTPGER